MSTDGGSLLLREVALRTGVITDAAACFADHRHPSFVEHALPALLSQRIIGICLDYDDINDHYYLQGESLLATACVREDMLGVDRSRPDGLGEPLASSSTLNRLELALPSVDGETPDVDHYHKIVFNLVASQQLFTDQFAASHRCPPKCIILDLDTTDDAIHGNQEGRFFHGYYDRYCYLPLYLFSDSQLLWAELRPSNQDGATGSVEAVAVIIERLRNVYG